ncbi:glycosyltransferase family 4 protein [Candidatus Daviesbacteria bacterium]|nr:glycosyltransferase family 4 protein [Candidatus Daviesbacteria bacterium]
MRVGMDISQLAHKGGVVTYTLNLAQQLSRVEDLDMVYFFSSLRKKAPLNIDGNIKKFYLPSTLFEMLFNKWRNIPIERFIGKVDIFHSSDWIQPPSRAKKVTTYHDVIPLKYPQWSHPKIVEVHKRRLKLVEDEIDMVIAVSETTKKDLLEVSRIPEKKITVIYEGSTISNSVRIQSEAELRRFREKYKLPERYILAIGGVGERKNLKRVKDACRGYNLVIAGVTLPWLNIEELKLLYASAEVLLYPSLYEGFGLPILDAQAYGCPVVTSNVSAMPEVAGKGAILVNPYSIEDIIRGIRQVKEIREEVIQKGFENVKRFSWEKCAKETVEVYGRLMR